jgi:hypothetical protein
MQFVSEHPVFYPVKAMCSGLHVSTGGYYNWLKSQRSARIEADQQLGKRVHEIHEKSNTSYGAPCIHPGLAKVDTLHKGRKRVARLI